MTAVSPNPCEDIASIDPQEPLQRRPPGRTGARNPARILLAEDDYELRRLMRDRLSSCGFEVTEVCDGAALKARIEYAQLFFEDRPNYDLIISDVRMPGLSGFEALAGLRRTPNAPPLIIITAFGDQQAYLQAARAGALAFFDKPLDLAELCGYVCNVVLPDRPQGEEPTVSKGAADP